MRSKTKKPLVSLIIPSLDDAELIRENIYPLLSEDSAEVLVVEAGRSFPKIPGVCVLRSPRANRAFQMNLGAQRAKGELLIFLHADTFISPLALHLIYDVLQSRPDCVGGAFRFALESGSWKARLVEAGVRLRESLFGLPYGDQALFVWKSVFDEVGGYPDVPLLEDVLLVEKIKKEGRLLSFTAQAMTSPRRWEESGYLKTTLANWATMIRWKRGASMDELMKLRKRLLEP